MNIKPFDFDLWLSEMLNLLLFPLSGTFVANLLLVSFLAFILLSVCSVAHHFGTDENAPIEV